MLKKIENFIFDEFQALKPRQSVELPVFVIAIDEKAIDDFGQWPWPRNILADLIYKLKLDYEVAAIGIDVIFSEKDRSSPTYSKFPASQDPNLAAKVNVNLDYDNLLATSILQSGNVVLPIALSNNSKDWVLLISLPNVTHPRPILLTALFKDFSFEYSKIFLF